MFTRAGFRRRFKTVCAARALRRGYSGTAYLLRFGPRDFLWLFDGRLSWEPPYLVDLVTGPPVHVGLAQSSIARE